MKTFLKIVLIVSAVLTAVVLLVLALIWPWSRLEFSPDATFRRLVSPTVPPSVTKISVEGYDTRYASDVTITFELRAEDREKILSARPYQELPCEEGEGLCYRSEEQEGHGIFDLYFADRSDRVWFNYWSS